MHYDAFVYRLDVNCPECGAEPDPDAPLCDTPPAEDLALGPLYNCTNSHHFRIPFDDAVVKRGRVTRMGEALPEFTIRRQLDVVKDE